MKTNQRNLRRHLQIFFSALTATWWLAAIAQVAAQRADYVIVISVDGLGGIYLSNLLARVDNTYPIPNFRRLKAEGASTLWAHIDNNNWETLPNHASIVTARPQVGPTGHNWTINGDPAPGQTIHSNKGAYVAGVFDVVHDNSRRTGMYANKTKFSLFDTNSSYPGGGSYSAAFGAPDLTGDDNGRDKVDNTFINTTLGGILVNTFIMDQTNNPMHYAFLHINEPDYNGHTYGWGSANWFTSVVTVDTMLGEIFKLVEQKVPALIGHTAIIVTADHGNQDNPPAGIHRFAVPIFVWGPGVAAGADLYALNASNRKIASNYPLPDYNGMQPIRNAEVNNLALQMFGLGPIPGSVFNAAQDLRVTPLPTPSITGITRNGAGNFIISGTANQNGKVVLWKSTNLEIPNWLPAGTNTVASGVPFAFTVAGTEPAAFFRMQGL